ncbi:hypothetical protein Dimus_029418, partial [Dionaea muscipula]
LRSVVAVHGLGIHSPCSSASDPVLCRLTAAGGNRRARSHCAPYALSPRGCALSRVVGAAALLQSILYVAVCDATVFSASGVSPRSQCTDQHCTPAAMLQYLYLHAAVRESSDAAASPLAARERCALPCAARCSAAILHSGDAD